MIGDTLAIGALGRVWFRVSWSSSPLLRVAYPVKAQGAYCAQLDQQYLRLEPCETGRFQLGPTHNRHDVMYLWRGESEATPFYLIHTLRELQGAPCLEVCLTVSY